MTTKLELRDQLIRKAETDCRHFNGIQNACCRAGVSYEALRDDDKRLPCLPMMRFETMRLVAVCDKFETMSHDEAVASADGDLAAILMNETARRAAHADAKFKGFGIGKGGHDSIPCPTGCGGQLYYRVASVNGHMHARCSTDKCVMWME